MLPTKENASGSYASLLAIPSNLREPVDEETMKMWRTPTTVDTKDGRDSLKHATKLVQGKTQRNSGHTVQITLSDEVMMEEIVKNPDLIKVYKDYQMIQRPKLPEQKQFVEFLRNNTSIKELVEKTNMKKTTIEHWFRRDKSGFSYPSVEDWQKIKPYLKTIQYDKEMTTVVVTDWHEKDQMWPTPTTNGYGQEGQYNNLYNKMITGIITQEDFEAMTSYKIQQMWPTPDANMGERGTQLNWTKTRPSGHHAQYTLNQAVRDNPIMWPTPRARDFKDGYVVPPSVQSGSRSHTLGTKVVEEKSNNIEKVSLNPDWVEWLMGYDRGWSDLDCDNPQPHDGFQKEPEDIPRVAKGKKNRAKRLKGLGNAVLPQIPMQIALAIKKTREVELCKNVKKKDVKTKQM